MQLVFIIFIAIAAGVSLCFCLGLKNETNLPSETEFANCQRSLLLRDFCVALLSFSELFLCFFDIKLQLSVKVVATAFKCLYIVVVVALAAANGVELLCFSLSNSANSSGCVHILNTIGLDIPYFDFYLPL